MGIGDLKASGKLRGVRTTAGGKDSAALELGMFRSRDWISRAGAIKLLFISKRCQSSFGLYLIPT